MRERSPTDDADTLVEVLFLTGQPGSGKTALAKELSELLWQCRTPHAVIELDELCRGVLPTPMAHFNRTLAVANLTAVWANFYAAGVRRLIITRIIETREDLDQFASAIPQAQVTMCILHAPADLIQQRLTEREPGSARMFLLHATRCNAAQIAELDLSGIQVDNGDRPIIAVACEILENVCWPHPPI